MCRIICSPRLQKLEAHTYSGVCGPRGGRRSSHVYDPLRYTPRMDPGALRTGGKLGKQLTFPGGDPLGSLGSE